MTSVTPAGGGTADLIANYYPEARAGGFSRYDGTVQFYQRVQALLRTGDVVLDFGAGRGAAYYQDRSSYRKALRDLRGSGRRIVGADVDPVVTTNPWLNESVVLDAKGILPFDSVSFDIVVSDSTFEHISDARLAASELDRVLKPGGWICARTPNRNGYVAVANRIIPPNIGKHLVTRAQPSREVQDIFPAYYRMNTLGALKSLFDVERYDHVSFAFDSEPNYHFGKRQIFLLLLMLHGLTPPPFRNTLMVFIHKRS